jgi:hypothetical protein
VPTLVWLYLTALLYDRTSAHCVALAEALAIVSHDRLTRRLQGDWSGQRRLALACRTLVVWDRGDLLLDDTVLPQPLATALAGPAWVLSRLARTPVCGLALVLRVWTHGTRRLPLGMRLWPTGGPAQDALALALRSDARHRLRCRPESVPLAAWSPATALLQRMRTDGGEFVCRLQKHRRCNGHAVRHQRRHPDWAESGWLTGGPKVLGVRYGKQDSATQRLTLTALEVRRLSQVRSPSAAVMRVGQEQLGLTGGQARSARAPRHHLACGLAAFGVRERERHDRHLSSYPLKRQLSFKGRSLALPSLERLRPAA